MAAARGPCRRGGSAPGPAWSCWPWRPSTTTPASAPSRPPPPWTPSVRARARAPPRPRPVLRPARRLSLSARRRTRRRDPELAGAAPGPLGERARECLAHSQSVLCAMRGLVEAVDQGVMPGGLSRLLLQPFAVRLHAVVVGKWVPWHPACWAEGRGPSLLDNAVQCCVTGPHTAKSSINARTYSTHYRCTCLRACAWCLFAGGSSLVLPLAP